MDVGARGVDQHAHLRELRADAVVLDQRLAALHAHLRPVDRLLVQRAGDAKDGGAGIGVRLREEFRQNVEALADPSHHVLVRDEAVLEDELGVVRQALAHLVVHAPGGEARPAALHQKAGRGFRHRLSRLGLREEQVMARPVAVGDEVLHAVHDPAARALPGTGAERRRVGEKIIGGVVGLGDADREHPARVGRKRGQDTRLLLRGERLLHDLRDLQRLGHDDGDTEVALGQLLDHHGGGKRIRLEPAPFFGERHGADADLMRLLHDLPGEALLGVRVRVERCGSRCDHVLDKTGDGRQYGALLLAGDEDVLHCDPLPLGPQDLG